MSTTPNLLISHVAPSQNNKETTLNTGLDELDQALTDQISIAITDADYTLSAGTGGEALGHMAYIFTGTLSAGRNIIVPNHKKLYIVSNQTIGSPASFALTVKTAAGTGVAVSSSTLTILYCDGTNVITVAGSSSSSTLFYQTVKQAGTARTQRANLNVSSPMTATDNSGTGATDIGVAVVVGDSGSGGTAGLVPAPGAGDAAAGKFLKADGTFAIPSGSGSGIGGVSVKSADYNLASGDNGKLIALSTGTHTFTLLSTPPSSAWVVFIENYGTGVLTIARNTTTIDGAAANITLNQNQGVVIYTDGTNYFTERGMGSAGVTAFTGLSDVPASYSGAGGKAVEVNAGATALVFSGKPFDMYFYIDGVTLNGQTLLNNILTRACTFPASATNSAARATVGATATATFTFKKNGTSFATLAFSGTTPTWTQASDATFNGTTDILEIDCPVTADATLAGIGITLFGIRS